VGRLEGKKPLGRHRHSWEDNIKMDLQEVGWGGTDWLELAQGRDRFSTIFTNPEACEYGTEPSGSIKCGKLHD
jgi:hypothetical protein